MALKIDPDPELKRNLMEFGWECNSGWYPLIRECMEELKKEAEKENLDTELLQVKEKFGTLRVYLSSESDDMFGIIQYYETLSSHLCELCGEFYTAKMRVRHGWYKTLCNKCAKEQEYEEIK
jgi:hypothetical protein